MMNGYYGGVWDTLFPMSAPTMDAIDALEQAKRAEIEQQVRTAVQEEGDIASVKATAEAKAKIEPMVRAAAYEEGKKGAIEGATKATTGVIVAAAVVLGLGYFLFWRR